MTIPLTISRHGGAVTTDHSRIPASLTFAAGQTRQSFTVTATDDSFYDAGESVTIGFGELPEAYPAGANPRARVALADNEEAVTFNAAEIVAAEGAGAGTVIVTLSSAPGAEVIIPLTVTENGLTTSADYIAADVPAALTFGPNDTSIPFTVSAVDDTADDDGESLTITFGTLPAPYGRGENPEATVALTDNDAPLAANGEVSTNENTDYAFSAADFGFDGADGDTLASVKIVSLPAQGSLTLNGTALTSADLEQTVTAAELNAGALLYSPPAGMTGDDFTSFTFRVNDGHSDSIAYTMTIDVAAVSTPSTRALVSNILQTTSSNRLLDTSFVFAQGFTTGSNTAGYVLDSIEVDVHTPPLDNGSGDSLTATLRREDAGNDERPGTQVAVLSRPSNLPHGAGVKTFEAPADTVLDPGKNYFLHLDYQGGSPIRVNRTSSANEDTGKADEWFILNQSLDKFDNPDPVYLWTTYGQPIKIRVNGYPVVLPDIEVNFGARSYTATEGGSAATVAVTLSRAPGTEVDIPLSLVSRNWGAEAADHSPIQSTLTFGAEDTSRTFTVTATDDTANDDGESVTIGLGELPEGYVEGRTDQTTVSLVDDEGTLVSNTGQTMADRSDVSIGDEAHEIIFRTGSHPGGYEVTGIDAVLTTTGATDIDTPRSSLIHWASDTTTGAVDGPSSLDANATKTYTFRFSQGTILLPSNLYVFRLENDRDPPALPLNTDNVYWRHTESTAEDGGSAPGWRIRDEADVSGISDPPPLLLSVNGRAVTTHDPAEVEVSFGADRYGAEEGGDPATVEVSLARAPSAPVTVPLRIVSRNGGAVAGDHSPIPAGVTFAAGQTEASFTVRAVDDNLDDDFESLTLGFGDLPAGLPRRARDDLRGVARQRRRRGAGEQPDAGSARRERMPTGLIGLNMFRSRVSRRANTRTATGSPPSSSPCTTCKRRSTPCRPGCGWPRGRLVASGEDRVELAGPAAVAEGRGRLCRSPATTATRPRPTPISTAPPRYWVVMEGLREDYGTPHCRVAVHFPNRRGSRYGAGVEHR